MKIFIQKETNLQKKNNNYKNVLNIGMESLLRNLHEVSFQKAKF